MMISTQDILYSISETGIFPDDHYNVNNPANEPRDIPFETLSGGMINRNGFFYQKITLPNLLFHSFSILLEYIGKNAFVEEIKMKLEFPIKFILKSFLRL